MSAAANTVAKVSEAPRRSLLAEMATRYGMEPAQFAATLKATVVPQNTTNEEFAAFLVVAREYNLNPLTKEIYAFPKRGGGIQPIVPIDGWTNIINSNPALDGIDFEDHHDDQGKLTAITCRLWRKDRAKPIMVTEYMSECVRATDTWKQYPHRMLRHKALIQCARYAFGLAGIVDPDEADRMMLHVTPPKPPAPPSPPAPPATAPTIPHDSVVEAAQAEMAASTVERSPEPASDMPVPTENPEAWLKWLDGKLAGFDDGEAASEWWSAHIEPCEASLFPPDWEEAVGVWRKHERRWS